MLGGLACNVRISKSGKRNDDDDVLNFSLEPKDTEDLFNFVPVEQPTAVLRPGQKSLGLVPPARKRARTEPTIYSYIKKPVTRGTKIIKIEIYDADNSPKSENSMCNCEAEVCAQHVVKTVLFDDIYSSAKQIISKIQDEIENTS